MLRESTIAVQDAGVYLRSRIDAPVSSLQPA
jgi:hypothetical protein